MQLAILLEAAAIMSSGVVAHPQYPHNQNKGGGGWWGHGHSRPQNGHHSWGGGWGNGWGNTKAVTSSWSSGSSTPALVAGVEAKNNPTLALATTWTSTNSSLESCPKTSTSIITVTTSITNTHIVTRSPDLAPSKVLVVSSDSSPTWISSLTSNSTGVWTSPAPTSPLAPTTTSLDCQPDNCLREIHDVRFSSWAVQFCKTYTTAIMAEPSMIPPYLENCSGSPNAVSSACSCLIASTTPAAASTPAVVTSATLNASAPAASSPVSEILSRSTGWETETSVVAPSLQETTVSVSISPIATGSGPYLHPSTAMIATTTITTQIAAGTPNPKAVLCGLHGLPVGDYFLAGYVEEKPDVAVTLQGCYEFCARGYGYNMGCRAYEFYLEPGTGAPRCDLFGGSVAQSLDSINNYVPNVWYDLDCGSPSGSQTAW